MRVLRQPAAACHTDDTAARKVRRSPASSTGFALFPRRSSTRLVLPTRASSSTTPSSTGPANSAPMATLHFGIPGGQPIPGLSSVSLGSGSDRGRRGRHHQQYRGQQVHLLRQPHLAESPPPAQDGRSAHPLSAEPLLCRQQRRPRVLHLQRHLLRTSTTPTSCSTHLPSKGRGAAAGTWGHRSWRTAIFAQDDWKVTSTFTINLGIRWEYAQPIYEVADRQVNIDTYTGKLLYAGPERQQPRALRGLLETVHAAHRAGLDAGNVQEQDGHSRRLCLHELHGRHRRQPPPAPEPAVLRRNQLHLRRQNTGHNHLGLLRRRDWRHPSRYAASCVSRHQPSATGACVGPEPAPTDYFPDELLHGVSARRATSFSAAYVGQKGTHLVAPHEANQPLAGTGPFSTWTNLNLRRPLINVLPNVDNIALTEASATMDYHSLQVTGRRRYSSGLEFLAAYTFGKTLTDNLGYYGGGFTAGEGAYWQNAYDRRGNRGPSFFDVTHNFTIGGLYDLPVGKGKKFGSDMNKAARPHPRRLEHQLLCRRPHWLPRYHHGDRPHRSGRPRQRSGQSLRRAQWRPEPGQH